MHKLAEERIRRAMCVVGDLGERARKVEAEKETKNNNKAKNATKKRYKT